MDKFFILFVAACALTAYTEARTCGGLCRLFCKFGFEQDANGCDICVCRDEPAKQCKMLCPFGLERDEDGITLCKCKAPESESISQDVPVKQCNMRCEFGFEKDLCICKAPPAKQCKMLCEFGFEKNSCKCKGEPAKQCKMMCEFGFEEDSCKCKGKPAKQCKMLCEFGFEKDSCKCKGKPVKECRMFCPNGFATDVNGKELCKCKEERIASICRMYCRYGFEKDANGNKICKCKKPVLPPCPPTGCNPAFCPNGFLKDKKGCFVGCQCAPVVMCKMFCKNGREQDANGKDLCKCKPEKPVLPVCPPTGCNPAFCPNGFLKDKKGCFVGCQCAPVSMCKMFCKNGREQDANGKDLCKCKPDILIVN